jgi:hypothetical protein
MMETVARTATSMKINNNVLAKVPVWQGFSGRNRLNSHSTRVRRTRERLPSNGCIESELLRSRLTGTVVPFASPGNRAALRPLSPLRTGLESFPSSGSSTQ